MYFILENIKIKHEDAALRHVCNDNLINTYGYIQNSK